MTKKKDLITPDRVQKDFFRDDSSFRSEEEDLQDLLTITRSHYANTDYSNYIDSLFSILKDAFISRWNIRKYNGGWK